MSDTASMIVPSVGEIVRLRNERDEWREFSVRVARCICAENNLRPLLFRADFKTALAEFDRLMEGSK